MSKAPHFVLNVSARSGKGYAAYVCRHLLAARQCVRAPLSELSLAFVGDKRMSELHLRFMGIEGPTDVLTFPLEMDSRGRPISGEVIVCIPQAVRQARARGGDVAAEVLLYALHGLLHLCGYDDRTAPAYRTMHRKEDDILKRLGVGPVFEPSAHVQAGIPHRGRKARRAAGPVRRGGAK